MVCAGTRDHYAVAEVIADAPEAIGELLVGVRAPFQLGAIGVEPRDWNGVPVAVELNVVVSVPVFFEPCHVTNAFRYLP